MGASFTDVTHATVFFIFIGQAIAQQHAITSNPDVIINTLRTHNGNQPTMANDDKGSGTYFVEEHTDPDRTDDLLKIDEGLDFDQLVDVPEGHQIGAIQLACGLGVSPCHRHRVGCIATVPVLVVGWVATATHWIYPWVGDI